MTQKDTRDISISTDLSGHTALITGASSGLGARFAEVLAAAGARIIMAARRQDRLTALASQLEETDTDVLTRTLDVNDLDGLPAFFDTLKAEGALPDILVNNAGMNIAKPALDLQPDEVSTIISTNMTAPFFLSTAFAKHHIDNKNPARIINIGSVGSSRVLPGLTPYCMSKSGILMMTRGLAREWARYDINVNAICPGYIETEINDFWWQTEGGQKQIASFPRKRLGQASDLDGVLLMLAGPLGNGITGSAFTVDDGQYI